jgi:hypothetical protein
MQRDSAEEERQREELQRAHQVAAADNFLSQIESVRVGSEWAGVWNR